MNDIDQLFFELIRVSIGTLDALTRAPSAQEWKQLYDMAKKQSLVGICFAGVQKLSSASYDNANTSTSSAQADGDNLSKSSNTSSLSELQYLTWMGMAAKIQQRNEVVNKQCCELSERLTNAGLEHCIMKGQQVGRYYSDLAALRQSGDIDVWAKGGMKKVVNYVQSIAPTKSMSHKHVHLNVYNDTSVEMHYIPAELHCPWMNKRLNTYLDVHSQFRMEAENNSLGGIYVPTDEFNVMHLTAHAFRHLFGEGITLRQLMDLYYVLMKWDASAEARAEMCREIEACGMMIFTKAMMYAMEKVFGMHKDKMLCKGSPEDGVFLLNLIMDDRNVDALEKRRKVGKKEPALARFIRVQKLNMRLVRIAPMEVVWTPLWRIWNWCWMKSHGYTYH